MTNQEITSTVVVKNVKLRTFNQEQLAQLFKGSKEFIVSNSPYEVSESRTYIDANIKMLITKYKVFNRGIKYSYFING